MRVLQKNAYFAHPENLLWGMLCDENESVHRIDVNKIQDIRRNSHYQCQIINYQDSEASLSQSNDGSRVAVRKFIFPKLNVKAKAYYQLVNLYSIDFEQPPALRHFYRFK